MRNAPIKSKGCQGFVERYHHAMHAHVRTLRLPLATSYKVDAVDIQASHPICDLTYTTCIMITQPLHGTRCWSYILPDTAQKVQATELSWRLRGKFCTTRCTANITSRNDTQAFIQACGWAKTQHSGDHIVATRTTIVKGRSIRRYIYNERVEIDHLLSLNSVPWNEQATEHSIRRSLRVGTYHKECIRQISTTTTNTFTTTG